MIDSAQKFAARLLDGRSARALAVEIYADKGVLYVQPLGWKVDSSQWYAQEAFQHAPRVIRFAASTPWARTYLELPESQALRDWLAAQGKGQSLVSHWQWGWRYSLYALMGLLCLTTIFYLWGLPLVASWAAPWVPESYVAKLDTDGLALLDDRVLRPSHLSAQRQMQLQLALQALKPPDDGPAAQTTSLHLVFRSSKAGPNALALPGGTVILTDELVALAPDDNAILGVLAHEWGHVAFRHTVQSLIQSGLVGVFFAVFLGDASSSLAAFGSSLANLHYSREHESQADQFSLAVMRKNHIPSMSTGRLLELLDHSLCKPEKQAPLQEQHECEQAQQWIPAYLATHPATRERIQTFEMQN